ncbi:MAG: alanine racemase [Spirochaeta sp.]|nr:alanine racemase [Spirochaeta sp.]
MRATRAVIRLGNLHHNIKTLHQHMEAQLGGKAPQMCIAVKADAYGHGIVRCAEIAIGAGANLLGVATVSEGAALREAGIREPILLFSIARKAELEELAELTLSPFVADEAYVRLLDEAAASAGVKLNVHLKVDTGMGRIGCRPEDAPQLASQIQHTKRLRLAGTATHFPVADEDNSQFTREQIDLFLRTVKQIRDAGIDPGLVHAANSGAIIGYPDVWADMVRPGIAVYGYYPSADQQRKLDLRPVMELLSEIVFVKRVAPNTPISYGCTYRTPQETVIATIPAGYGDGFNRLLSSIGRVQIDGKTYPIVGRVCMDQFMVDIGADPQCGVGSTVTLFGPDPAGPNAEELAELCSTIPYDILTSVTARVPRIYLE